MPTETPNIATPLTRAEYDRLQGFVTELAAQLGVNIAMSPAEQAPLALVPEPEPIAEDELPILGHGILFRSAARQLIRWGVPLRGYTPELRETEVTQEMIEFYWRQFRHQGFEASCAFAEKFTGKVIMNPTPVAAAHFIFSGINGAESAESFLRPLGTGANLDEGSPALVLRNKLIAHRSEVYAKRAEALSNDTVLVMLMRAYAWHLKPKKISKLHIPEDFCPPSIPRIA